MGKVLPPAKQPASVLNDNKMNGAIGSLLHSLCMQGVFLLLSGEYKKGK